MYGKAVNIDLRHRRRGHREIDDALQEFIDSGAGLWELNIEMLPSPNINALRSSLLSRIRSRKLNVKVISLDKKLYLENLDVK